MIPGISSKDVKNPRNPVALRVGMMISDKKGHSLLSGQVVDCSRALWQHRHVG